MEQGRYHFVGRRTFHVPAALRKVRPFWSELDGCHLDNNLQTRIAEFVEQLLTLGYIISNIFEGWRRQEWLPHGHPFTLGEVLPPPTCIHMALFTSPAIFLEGLRINNSIGTEFWIGWFPVETIPVAVVLISEAANLLQTANLLRVIGHTEPAPVAARARHLTETGRHLQTLVPHRQ